MRVKIIFLSGAGVSAESGISTFRDSNGLWEQHRIEDVASIEGWYTNPGLVIDFYNKRRAQLPICEPNEAHRIIAELEEHFDVTVITQNIDNL
ncbi:MAG: NAD-dependent protein deacylase, partial [Bacteroidales bacterium]|nr:NAD-dependent protein deacylase [Bacteroidales bacterium]